MGNEKVTAPGVTQPRRHFARAKTISIGLYRSASLRQTQRATEHRLVDLRSMIALEVRQAWFTLQEARARTEVARGAVEQAEENLRIANQQYAAGLVNSTRVLEAEALRVQSLGNRENAALDASIAQLRLARTVGRL